jgi:hypothetical protein
MFWRRFCAIQNVPGAGERESENLRAKFQVQEKWLSRALGKR